ncbi:hypothetical protein PARHAE_00759 [Paracoccus haematequi]|uniref:Phage tail tube protein, GTA-gp10 n=1 Tax=Paracoccus haematequi TaxID=2491866 RepID=A0A3S5D3V2_9RHOB|nr:gene transfer agent family protein [Paracoccus haematequi]VDS07582.1 hypothetical protein PARHAE_00759 [Paracoccus haematequi]
MKAISTVWPGGEHSFRLGLAELEAVQQKTDYGPEWLLHRINTGQWKTDDLFEVLRFGLIGGGMDAAQAKSLVHTAFERHPAIGFKVPAQAVLAAFLYGPPDDPVGEDLPVGPTPESEKTGDGSSAATTD